MKYTVGYYEYDEYEHPLTAALDDFGESIGEIYFPWESIATCRTSFKGLESTLNLIDTLRYARHKGIQLDLLCNANCYGGKAISKELEKNLLDAIDELYRADLPVDVITTTSPAIAFMVKKHFKEIRVRASVNMRLGEEQALRPLFSLFDEFYLQREYNHDFKRIAALKKVLDGRPLLLLANSGCMPWCPGQIFHDNLVAHEQEVSGAKNIEGFMPYVCWSYLKDHPEKLLEGTWIRPEDIQYYEEEFSLIKLATRIHSRPYSVIEAYVRRSFGGSILNLMEPDHSSLLGKVNLKNTDFPNDWLSRQSAGIDSAEEWKKFNK